METVKIVAKTIFAQPLQYTSTRYLEHMAMPNGVWTVSINKKSQSEERKKLQQGSLNNLGYHRIEALITVPTEYSVISLFEKDTI